MHGDSSFITLTYDQEHLPNGNSLNPEDPQLFLKRLRKKLSPRKLRYYLVGEYGDQTQRPHYHAAIFGVSILEETLVQEAWGNGHVLVGDLTKESAQYIAGYVTKKMTNKNDPRLNGRYPEFARMSLRPGIGAQSMDAVAEVLTTEFGSDEILRQQDVPSQLRHGGGLQPLGRYLKGKLREKLGFPDKKTPKEVTLRLSQEMSVMFSEALKAPENTSKSLASILVEQNKQKILNLETRTKIYNKKGNL